MTAPTARIIEDDEFADWVVVPRTAMLGDLPDADGVESMRSRIDVRRCVGAFDGSPGGRPVGSAGSFGTEVAVPGGGRVGAGAVTAVGVLPTHRRQGHLTRMMRFQLADIVERDEPLAVLVAAEYPIYGRYGYGPAAELCVVRIDASAPDLWVEPPTGRVELVDNATFAKELVDVYDRVWTSRPGHLDYEDWRWPLQAGEIEWPGGDAEELRKRTKVVWRDDADEVGAVAAYKVDETWTDNRPQGTLQTNVLVAASAVAEREIVRYLTEVDWVSRVQLNTRPVDHPAPLWLRDGRRALLQDRSDHVWARILDVPRALSERRYAVDGRLVLEVADRLGFAGGRYALEGGPEGSLCATTDDDPDLVLDVGALGAAYLGGATWARLAAGGWVDEARPGALERASTMFATARAPWCALTF